jgi:hypothetical protein
MKLVEKSVQGDPESNYKFSGQWKGRAGAVA